MDRKASSTRRPLPSQSNRPTQHPDTGKPYEWAGDWRHIPRLPDALLKLWRELSALDSRQKPRLEIEHDPVLKALDEHGMVLGQIHGKLGGWSVRCPWESEHTGEGGKADTAYFEPHTNGYVGGAFKCLHSHCANRGIRELQVWLGPQPGAEYAPAGDSASREWPEPLPLAVKVEPEPYQLDALPGTIRAAVEEVQAFTKAPVPLVASSALGALSLAIQPHADVKRAEKLTGPVCLYLLSIADSGERKSTCDGFFTAAIRKYEREQAEAFKPELKHHKAGLAAWTAERDGILLAIKEASKKGKASEAGAVLGAHGMSKDSITRNLALLNILWDGGVLPIGRRTSESFTVRGVRLTMALQIQEATLRSFFDRSNGLARGTGFLARSWWRGREAHKVFDHSPNRRPTGLRWPHLTGASWRS